MNLNYLVVLLIPIILIGEISTQSAICKYEVVKDDGYECELTLNSQSVFNGLISGEHLAGKTNDDVQKISVNSESQFTSFPTFVCDKFTNVKIISLENAKIDTVDKDTFKNCKNLEYINLSGNKQKILLKDFFENQSKLLTLNAINLSNGKLTILNANSLNNLKNLKHLYLNGNNKVQSSSSTSFSPLKNVEIFYLNKNNLTSDGELIPSNSTGLKIIFLNSDNSTTVDDNKFEERLAGMEKKFAHLETENNQLKTQVNNMKDENLGEKLKTANTKITLLTAKSDELSTEIGNLISKNQELTIKNEEISKTVQKMMKEMENSKDDLEALTGSFELLNQEMENLKKCCNRAY